MTPTPFQILRINLTLVSRKFEYAQSFIFNAMRMPKKNGKPELPVVIRRRLSVYLTNVHAQLFRHFEHDVLFTPADFMHVHTAQRFQARDHLLHQHVRR